MWRNELKICGELMLKIADCACHDIKKRRSLLERESGLVLVI